MVHDLILQLYANMIYYWCLSVKLVDFFSCTFILWILTNSKCILIRLHSALYHWSADISIPNRLLASMPCVDVIGAGLVMIDFETQLVRVT